MKKAKMTHPGLLRIHDQRPRAQKTHSQHQNRTDSERSRDPWSQLRPWSAEARRGFSLLPLLTTKWKKKILSIFKSLLN